MKKKIDFKKPKYIIPLLILPFIIGIAYVVKDMFKEKVDTLESTEEINMNIPEANLEKRDIKSKLDALENAYKKSSDYSSIQEITPDEKVSETEDLGSLYTTEEMLTIDSLNNASRIAQEQLQKQYDEHIKDQEEPKGKEEAPKNKIDEEMELFRRQMAYIDSLQNPKPKQTPKIVQNQKNDDVLDVKRATNPQVNHFNTIRKNTNNSTSISVILDENIKAIQGSRLRFRLMDDIVIGENIISKGNYIYGEVSGFKDQRVLVKISSVAVNNRPLKVDLSIYDNDGQEGFFVPASAFRDFTKDVGGQTSNQSIQIDQQGGGVEQFAYGALQDAYKSAQQAIGKRIKQNKALLKYNTQVFLVNNKEKNK